MGFNIRVRLQHFEQAYAVNHATRAGYSYDESFHNGQSPATLDRKLIAV